MMKYLTVLVFFILIGTLIICLYIALIEARENKVKERMVRKMYKRGKVAGIKEQLADYERIKKEEVKEPIVIQNIVKGMSEENGLFIYVAGLHQGQKVCVAVPNASLVDFKDITSDDVEEIKNLGLKFYLESHTSKKGRLYYTAYIDA